MGLTILTVVLWIVAAAWLFLGSQMIRAVLSVRRLPALDVLPAVPVAPSVTVIVACRDEGQRIEKTVRQIMGQQGVELQLIVIDDRSADDTPLILTRLAGEFPGLQPIRVDQLPDKWLGKCHAMHMGSQSARGQWLLFTDGDVWFKDPNAIVRGIAAAEAAKADHVCLTPGQTFQRPPSIAYHSCMLVFHVLFGVEMGRANRDEKNAMAGVGAYNLVRADAYRAFGGHEALRLEIADDMKMGLLLSRVGRRSRVFNGDGVVEADWADSVWGIVKALEKNSFVVFNYSLYRLVPVTVLFFAMWLGAILGPFTFTWAGYSAATGMGLMVVAAIIQASVMRQPIVSALVVPISILIIPYIFWHSAVKTLRQGGVRWRDTFYPLPLLREHLIRTDKSGPFSV